MALGSIKGLKLSANEFYAKLKQGQLSSCYWLHGDELLLVQEAATCLREVIVKLRPDCEKLIFYADLPGFDWQHFLMAASNHSLFAEQRILEVRLFEQKLTVQILSYLQQFLTQNNPDDILIISSQKLEARLQKHKSFIQLSKQCIDVAFWPLQGRNLQQWLSQRARALKLRLTSSALDYLALQTTGNLLAAAQELEKLALLYQGEAVDEQIMHEHIAQGARFQVFQLMDDVLARQVEAALRALTGLELQGESEVLVLWGMLRDIRLLLKVKVGASEAELRRENIWPRRLRLLQHAARGLSVSTLEELILSCKQAELVIKGVQPGSAWQVLTEIACVLMGLKGKVTI
ncbi:DNA polymerase III subunit delta [Piscirickettsia salmonis]|nr:DNA polymerase III subunit delta [Piscirickettsia salmonis LF-89 = ATCC VR-1361]ALY03779.1 DNA polymerase III subunit delta [Piscirickettsia salmonis]AMA43341.1 DNA polymerase III subunit delta [Piscirickettsia salmonis]AOS35811.1 DNA polymerase III subunit delta [Piscirickettsia salmonis]APS60515.1 DNA polymerase III subunit delta [Piscirickettsia salmonis]